MGLLSQGTPMDWAELKKINQHVRRNAIEQLINIFVQHKDRKNDPFYWGDEVEYMLVNIDDRKYTAKLSIDHDHVLETLNDPEKLLPNALAHNVVFHPEYGRFMLEGTPARPYDGNRLSDYVYVERNMQSRRCISQQELPKHIVPLTLTSFPRMGCPGFTSPCALPIGPALQSLFLPDEIINRHVRFPTLTANIRKRRGCKVAINLPFFPDKKTLLLDESIVHRDLFTSDMEPFLGAALPGHVYMDLMGFGMGLSCLQVTMQAADVNEARYLYDSLAPLTPIMLSLSAAAPIFKGYLVNQDVRWNVISGAVDDRTFVERGVDPYRGYHLFGGLDVDHHHPCEFNQCQYLDVSENGDLKGQWTTHEGSPIRRIPKSRYDSIDSYLGDIHTSKYFDSSMNDINPPINLEVLQSLCKSGMDDPLARHFAHLFVRDPLVVFSERQDQDNLIDNDHFENIQLTNWQTLRFKPPAPISGENFGTDTGPGWRVEFRPMEIQLSDFENAAYLTFIALVSRAICKFAPNWYIPISKIETNMKTAHLVNLAVNSKFWFKLMDQWGLRAREFQGYDLSWFDRYCNDGNDEMQGAVYLEGLAREPECASRIEANNILDCDGQTHRYTCHQLINGTSHFPGLMSLAIKVIASDLVCESATHHCLSKHIEKDLLRLKNYFMLISRRASGQVPTTASWIRSYVLALPYYTQDLKVSDRLNYELIKRAQDVSNMNPDALNHLLGPIITNYIVDAEKKDISDPEFSIG